ncbi:hypothetical protein AWC38_SpisGene10754 [Stylophora pistillata]|uniref:B30.2/SPRY domain-containing protein n=1 Tax=Stylophora pistillata TaxID=50429 RepID=A0A2B4S756_STYPI|nr:hypothetical protein AWC38_SpisGene10754 [Stylophora pistillata]
MLLILNARYDRFVGTLSLLILPATCWLRQNAAACSMSLVYVGPQPRRISLLSTGYHHYSLAATKWTKHGLTAVAIPGHDPPTDTTVYQPALLNPGPYMSDFAQIPSLKTPAARNYHIHQTEVIQYSRHDLLCLRSNSMKPGDRAVFQTLKSFNILRYRGKRSGKKVKERYERSLSKSLSTMPGLLSVETQRNLHWNVNTFQDANRNESRRERASTPTLLVGNVRSLLPKIDELECVAVQNNVDVVCLTETWLFDDIPDSALLIQRSYRRDTRDSCIRAFGAWITAFSWCDLFSLESCLEKFEYFHRTLLTSVNTFLPIQSSRTCLSDKPWINKNIKAAIDKRQKYLSKFGKDSFLFKRWRNNVIRLISRSKKAFYKAKVKSLKDSNIGQWWKSVKSLPGISSREGQWYSQLIDGTSIDSVDVLVDRINSFFCDLTSSFTPIVSSDAANITVTEIPEELYVSENEAYKALTSTKIKKASGPDDLPSVILKVFAFELAPVVANIYNATLKDGLIPPLLKCAIVHPIPKQTPPKFIYLSRVSLLNIEASRVKNESDFETEEDLNEVLREGDFDAIEQKVTPKTLARCKSNTLLKAFQVSKQLRDLAHDANPEKDDLEMLEKSIDGFTSALIDPLKADADTRNTFQSCFDDVVDEAIDMKQKKITDDVKMCYRGKEHLCDHWNVVDFIILVFYLITFVLRIITWKNSTEVSDNRLLAVSGYLYGFIAMLLTLRAFGQVSERVRGMGEIQIALFFVMRDVMTILWQFLATILAFSLAMTKVYVAEKAYTSGKDSAKDLEEVSKRSLTKALPSTPTTQKDNALQEWSFKRAITVRTYSTYHPIPVPFNLLSIPLIALWNLCRKCSCKTSSDSPDSPEGGRREALDKVVKKLQTMYFEKYGYEFPLAEGKKIDHLVQENEGSRKLTNQIVWQVFRPRGNKEEKLASGQSAWYDSPGISVDGCLLTYLGSDFCDTCKRGEPKEIHSAKFKSPFTPETPRFEVLIQETGERRIVALGVVHKSYDCHKMPGWYTGTVGYHVDDGKIFDTGCHKHGREVEGAMAYRGDLIACEVDFGEASKGKITVFFTLNGKEVEHSSMEYTSGKELFPFVSLGFKGITVLTKMCHRDRGRFSRVTNEEIQEEIGTLRSDVQHLLVEQERMFSEMRNLILLSKEVKDKEEQEETT